MKIMHGNFYYITVLQKKSVFFPERFQGKNFILSYW